MNQAQLETTLADLSLGGVRYFDKVGSTNDEAAAWAAQDAPDLAVVVADTQSSGRGRSGRTWYTPPGAGLAFSVVVYATFEDSAVVSRMTALGALAVCDTLKNRYQLPAKIKWPNDVLVDGKKVAGVLVEAHWTGDRLGALILGVGINVAPASVESTPPGEPGLHFPSTCIESALDKPVERLELLYAVLANLLRYRRRLAAPDFLRAWQTNLAYLNEWVQILPGRANEDRATPTVPTQEGQVLGLSNDGALKLRTRTSEIIHVQVGEVRLRPVKTDG